MPDQNSHTRSHIVNTIYTVLALLISFLITSSTYAGLQGGGWTDINIPFPNNNLPPVKVWETASEIVVTPGPGEVIEVLYIDEGAGIKYYRAIGPDYERGARADVHGRDFNIVPPVKKVHYSDMKKRFYWSTENTIETIMITESDHKLLAQTSHYQPNAYKWIWMDPNTFWFWDDQTKTWNYLLGKVLLFNSKTSEWHNLVDTNLFGWLWMDDLPWLYSSATDTWYYVVGDMWTYSNNDEVWQRIENTDAMQVNGSFGTSYYEDGTENFYFQLDPPADSASTLGSIQKLSIPSMQLNTAVDLTNATHITSFPSKGELYWSETTGVYANMAGDIANRPLLLTSPLGQPSQVIYKEPSPSFRDSIYRVDVNMDMPDKESITIDFMEQNEFRMGYGNIFISGIYTWIKTGTHTASIKLISQSLINTPGGLQANTVEEAFTVSSGTVILPKEMTVQLTYKDTMNGRIQVLELLANNSATINHGSFMANGGIYSGSPTYNVQDLQGYSVQKLMPQEDLNQLIVDLVDDIGLPEQEILVP